MSAAARAPYTHEQLERLRYAVVRDKFRRDVKFLMLAQKLRHRLDPRSPKLVHVRISRVRGVTVYKFEGIKSFWWFAVKSGWWA